MFASLSACVISFTLDLGYIFQQVGASPWLGTSQGLSGSAKILPVSQLFMSSTIFVLLNFIRFSLYPKLVTQYNSSEFLFCINGDYYFCSLELLNENLH